ncbi:hypothetical protein SARC_10399, partial [Sphaeroforma arctica JP610]
EDLRFNRGIASAAVTCPEWFEEKGKLAAIELTNLIRHTNFLMHSLCQIDLGGYPLEERERLYRGVIFTLSRDKAQLIGPKYIGVKHGPAIAIASERQWRGERDNDPYIGHIVRPFLKKQRDFEVAVSYRQNRVNINKKRDRNRDKENKDKGRKDKKGKTAKEDKDR